MQPVFGTTGRKALRPLQVLLACLLVAVVVLTAALTYSAVGGYGMTDMLVDPAQSFEYSGRWGAVSHFGVMAWTVAASLAVAGSRDDRLPNSLRAWLLRAGFLTFILALDDVLMLHERFGWRVPGGEPVLLAILACFAAALVLPGSSAVRRHPARSVVLIVLLLLGTSVVVDAAELRLAALLQVSQEVPVVVEEVAKVLGIAAWVSAVLSLTRIQHSSGIPGSMRRGDGAVDGVYPVADAESGRSEVTQEPQG